MISESIKTMVANATVSLLRQGGQGVLVKNSLIVTAAHCIDYKCDGSMVLEDFFIEEIKTLQGKKLKVTPWAVEPVKDIAILGSLDGQSFYDEANEFEEFCEKTKPVSLCFDSLKSSHKFPIYIYTHKKTWIKGEAARYGPNKESPSIGIQANEQIEGGTSGSPIINEQGQLVAIVSNSKVGIPYDGSAPRPHLALPAWASRSIRRGHVLYDELTPEEKELGRSIRERFEERKQRVHKEGSKRRRN